MIVVTKTAFNKLSAKTKTELLGAVFGTGSNSIVLPNDVEMADFDWTDRVDLTPGEVESFIDDSANLYEGTVKGLEVFARHGPMIHSDELMALLVNENGDPFFEDLATFQRSTTRRVRSVTGGRADYLLAWNNWQDGKGYYAVTADTHRSLKVYFDLI